MVSSPAEPGLLSIITLNAMASSFKVRHALNIGGRIYGFIFDMVEYFIVKNIKQSKIRLRLQERFTTFRQEKKFGKYGFCLQAS